MEEGESGVERAGGGGPWVEGKRHGGRDRGDERRSDVDGRKSRSWSMEKV